MSDEHSYALHCGVPVRNTKVLTLDRDAQIFFAIVFKPLELERRLTNRLGFDEMWQSLRRGFRKQAIAAAVGPLG